MFWNLFSATKLLGTLQSLALAGEAFFCTGLCASVSSSLCFLAVPSKRPITEQVELHVADTY